MGYGRPGHVEQESCRVKGSEITAHGENRAPRQRAAGTAALILKLFHDGTRPRRAKCQTLAGERGGSSSGAPTAGGWQLCSPRAAAAVGLPEHPRVAVPDGSAASPGEAGPFVYEGRAGGR